ncbi:Protein of unknown function, partial [Gryllus bimaculatus]
PAAPLELRCARAEPRALALRWRLPLRAGGRLSEARMEVRGPAGSRRRFFSTRPERDALWEQRTEDGVLGRPATLFLWTTPDGRLAEGKCPSLTRTQHTHTPPPPSAREMASETAGDGNPERILEVEDVTASSWRASDGVGSENAGDEAGGGAGTADGGRRCGAAGGSGREGTAAGDSGCGGVGSGSSAEGWGDGMHGEGRDGGGGVGSTAVSLSKWSWLPGVCIFLLFLLALVIIAVSRRRKIIRGPSHTSTRISILNQVADGGRRAAGRFNEAFLESFLSTAPARACNDYDSVISECSRSLWARSMLPSICASRAMASFARPQVSTRRFQGFHHSHLLGNCCMYTR